MIKKNKTITLLFALIVLLGAFGACKRTVENGEILGPNLVSAPSDFTGLYGGKLTTRVINNKATFPPAYQNTIIDKTFNIRFGFGDNILFEGDLSHNVTWYLNLKGETSDAVINYSGTGNKINIDTLSWDGKAEGYRFFLHGEKIAYTLSFLGSSIKYNDTLFIRDDAGLGPKNYKSIGTEIGKNSAGEPIKFYPLDNFEGAGGIQTFYSDAADGNGKTVFYTRINDRVEGRLSFYMKGKDLNGNNYCGGSSDETLVTYWGRVKETDPGNVFINAYIYGYGKPNSSVFFQLYENDKFDPTTAVVPTGWDGKNNDMWQFIQEVNWVGWRLVSIPYSSFRPANNPLAGGNGNRILEPHKISGAGIEAESYPNPGYEIEISMDLYNITVNGPFRP